MSRFWSISEWLQQVSARVRFDSQFLISPPGVLLAITLAIFALSFALESPLLFLLAVGQGAAVVQLCDARNGAIEQSAESSSTILSGIRERLPTIDSIQRSGSRAGIVVYRILYRFLVCLIVSLAAGLATLSGFVLNQAEMWQWRTLQTAGPPLGAMLVTGWVTLLVLLASAWVASRRPLLPR